MSDKPIIDLQSDEYFMRDAIRQAVKAGETNKIPQNTNRVPAVLRNKVAEAKNQ